MPTSRYAVELLAQDCSGILLDIDLPDGLYDASVLGIGRPCDRVLLTSVESSSVEGLTEEEILDLLVDRSL